MYFIHIVQVFCDFCDSADLIMHIVTQVSELAHEALIYEMLLYRVTE